MCMLDALHTHRAAGRGAGSRREGALPGVTGDWGFAFSTKGNHSLRSACIIAAGKGGMPGALPSLHS